MRRKYVTKEALRVGVKFNTRYCCYCK